ncbi:MAG: pyruvate kinase [Phycisphaerae bacterium]|nr:pyruvate kinase [Phycisphaerae bacterium]
MNANRLPVNHATTLTRIVATVGPASVRPAVVEGMLRAGVSLVRLNLSHSDPATHAKTLRTIRTVAEKLRMQTGVLADLPGPKLRLRSTGEGATIALRHGEHVRFVDSPAPIDPTARPVTLHADYPKFVQEVRVGDRVLIDDGAVQLRVVRRRKGALECVCEVGGTISGRKGINLPETALSLRAPTPRDHTLADWAVRHGADFVALSFVQGPEDIRRLRRTLERSARACRGRVPRIVAKIERPVALTQLGAIAAECDAMMVARGDLAIELDYARVPVEQLHINLACERAAIPCIVATQMLQSMMEAPLPTRAEASDVANSVFGGADAVMLSGETAAGRHPVAAVDAMRRIALEAESWIARQPPRPVQARELFESGDAAVILARSIAQLATDGGARAIVAWTDARSLRFISQTDVRVPIFAFGDHEPELRSLSLLRGVRAICVKRPIDTRDFVRTAERLLRGMGALKNGDRLVVATGFAGKGTERLWVRDAGAKTV